MPIYSGFPSSGAKDWDDASSTSSALTMFQTVNADGEFLVDQYGYANLNTSAVTTGGTITAATLTFRNLSKETASSQVSVHLWSPSNLYNVHAYTRAAGLAITPNNYVTTALTSAAQLACINASGGAETALEFSVLTTANGLTDVTTTWKVYAYEFDVSASTRVGIRYNEPSGVNNRRRIMIIE